MTLEHCYEKLNNNEQLTNNEMVFLFMNKVNANYQEHEDDINRLAVALDGEMRKSDERFEEMRAEFGSLHKKFDEMQVSLLNTEKRLSKKIDFYHEKLNARIDWVETKIAKLA